jgi:hypothetical protein
MILIKKIYIPLVLLFITCLSSCSKVVDNTSTAGNGSGGGSIIPVTPGGGSGTGSGNNGGTSGSAYIKFFNVLYDYNAVTCALNGATVASVSDFYPSAYITATGGTNNITLAYQTTPGVLNVNVALVTGNYYSCFIYKVGYDWKISLVNDNLTLPSTGYFNVRILDFRTQAYFDYINTRIYAPGSVSELDQSNRHFLDHTTYDTYTTFNTLPAGKYNFLAYNDTANLVKITNYNFASGKIYSIILTTAAGQSSADALFNIQTDIEANN